MNMYGGRGRKLSASHVDQFPNKTYRTIAELVDFIAVYYCVDVL